MARLVLWDIDHTLIATGGVGRELSAAAFEQVLGIPMREQATVDGLTEAVIFRETARLHGVDSDRAMFERFAAALAEEHVRRASDLRERGHALPGAAAALAELAAAGVRQTVVTGNVRAVAGIKLAVFGLDRHIDWAAGAYGEDADLRPALVRIALARAEASPVDAVVIGDTPADMAGARANGVPVIGVATGRSDPRSLQRSGADTVLMGLDDTDGLVDLVLGTG
ncbi:HAD family hydrolase [Streptomyces uncialis]|uniref:HAD family hydrolase n=1 Tax=Streptomyces uncialis TaxID=1048205 RepID=UPI00386A93D8|nr:haloacid dehalogenase-like hydrolase [Streptomyces uncialis]